MENKPLEQDIEELEKELRLKKEILRSTTGGTSSDHKLAVPISIVVAGIVIAGAIMFSNRSSGGSIATGAGAQPQQQAGQQPAQAPDISKVKIAGQPSIGNPDAPVTIAYWYDFQCPFCRRVEENVMSQLINDYVKTGKVKIVYKDYQFLGEDSQTAGLAERAVWEAAPDKFYQWHKAMYDKQDDENAGWGNKADILALTASLGIDAARVEQLMTTKAAEYQKAMDADKAEGSAFGITGTPSVIIGKKVIQGAQPFAAFKAAIDEALKK